MYTREQIDRVKELVQGIKDCEQHDPESSAATYRDVPSLQAIEKIIQEGMDEEKDTLKFAYGVYYFLGDQYTSLGRFVIAARIRLFALKLAVEAHAKYDEEFDHVDSVYYSLLRDRNYYVDDVLIYSPKIMLKKNTIIECLIVVTSNMTL